MATLAVLEPSEHVPGVVIMTADWVRVWWQQAYPSRDAEDHIEWFGELDVKCVNEISFVICDVIEGQSACRPIQIHPNSPGQLVRKSSFHTVM